MADARQHQGADPERTGARLAVALLAYFVFVTAVITLSPFDFHVRPVHISLRLKLTDIVANVAMFLPVGFLGRGMRTSTARNWRPILLAASFSLLIETAQLFIRGRFASPVDVATNTLGAYVGVLVRERIERWALWTPALAGRIGLDVPLVGLLYLLVPQLWLSGVGLIVDPARSVNTLLLGCAGSIVLVSLHRHRWQDGARLAPSIVVPLIALIWFTVGALPTFAVAPSIFGLMAGCVVIFAAWLRHRPSRPDSRRFEVATLRRVIPLLAVYVVLAATWPLLRPLAPLHGAIGFIDRLNNAAVIDLLLLLEQIGGFTLLGYAVSEWRGRRERGLIDDLYVVVPLALAFAAQVELIQGVLTGPGASLMRALLSTSGAVYGVAVYHLARAHVRALRVTTAEEDRALDQAA